MDLKDRLFAAQKALDDAQDTFTDSDREEIAARKQLAKLAEDREEIESLRRDLDLQRRLDKAVASDPNTEFRTVAIKSFPDTFIVMRNSKAHAAWKDATRASAKAEARGGKGSSQNDIDLRYVLATVYDWNGDPSGSSDTTNKLSIFLRANQGLLTPLTDAAAELAGVFADDRAKSG